MIYENLLIATKEHINYITINRAAKLNALNSATLKEINLAITAAENDKGIRVIILTGDGTKAFVAGADISEFAHFSIDEGKKLSAQGHHQVFDLIENCSKPVIAAINGFALGGGLELAMACHIRVASDNAKMGLPEVSLGVIPGYGGTQRLTQLVGKGKALEMITTADMIDAEQAKVWGLVNHVCTQEELIAKCEEIAGKIISRSPIAVSAAIRAVNAHYSLGPKGYQAEIDEFGKCFGTADFKEGTSAFLEKRKPAFPGN